MLWPPWRGGRGRWLRIAVGALLATLIILHLKPIRTARELAGVASPSCRVLTFTDGDTLDAWCPGEGAQRIRLTGYDTPEIRGACLKEQAMAFAATLRLASLVFAADEVRFRFFGRDRYDRRLGAMFLDGAFVADLMVAEGWARRYDGGVRLPWCGRDDASG